PQWLVEAIEFLNGADDSSEWNDLVVGLSALERLLGFPMGLRPSEVTSWIKSGRHCDRCPVIEDEEKFGEDVEQWWVYLQPGWRLPLGEDDVSVSVTSLSQEIPSEGENWSELQKGSTNGFFLILLCLAWWNTALQDSSRGDEELEHKYLAVFEDVLWV
ncbi:hypothetical protein BV22DRAFT_987241, partial [Leucogyrophana mollusca]